eukprot:6180099-Pleurochrysis_carterae.AAC.1
MANEKQGTHNGSCFSTSAVLASTAGQFDRQCGCKQCLQQKGAPAHSCHTEKSAGVRSTRGGVHTMTDVRNLTPCSARSRSRCLFSMQASTLSVILCFDVSGLEE